MKTAVLLQDFLHLFFPRYCPGCGTDAVNREQPVCAQCFSQLPHTHFFEWDKNPVMDLFSVRMPVQHAGSCFYFTRHSVIRQLLHQLKYHNQPSMAGWLGLQTAMALKKASWIKEIDAVVPVPLHPHKKYQRGYNQAELIGQKIAEEIKAELLPDILARSRHSVSQTHKSRMERWESMESSFQLQHPEKIAGKHVLLVDDVLTTSATLEFCGREILKAPGARLSMATVAIALR